MSILRDVAKWMERNSYFDLEDESTSELSFTTSENGDSDEEEYGEFDMDKAFSYKKDLLHNFKDISISIYDVDEYVYLDVKLTRINEAKGRMIGKGTFSKVYLDDEYKMPLYNKVRAPKRDLKKKDFDVYMQLKRFYKNLSLPMSYNSIYKDISNTPNKELSTRLKKLLKESLSALSNYGADIGFEISPRSIATDKKGNLILLDIWFFRSALMRKRR